MFNLNPEIKLDRIKECELEKIRNWRNDPNIYQWCRQIGPISEIDQKRWFMMINRAKDIEMFAIRHIDQSDFDTRIIGVCGLTSIDLINRRAEFSLYINSMDQKKGYAELALKSLFNYGFNYLNLNRIWGETFSTNKAQFLFEKIGMEKEGIRREHYFKRGNYMDAILFSLNVHKFNQSLLNSKDA